MRCTSVLYDKHLSTNIMVLRTFLVYSMQQSWNLFVELQILMLLRTFYSTQSFICINFCVSIIWPWYIAAEPHNICRNTFEIHNHRCRAPQYLIPFINITKKFKQVIPVKFKIVLFRHFQIFFFEWLFFVMFFLG